MVIGWFTRIAVGLTAVAVVGFDGFSTAAARLAVPDDAQAAAAAAADAWTNGSHDVQAAYDTAKAYGANHHELVPPELFTVAPDGTVTLTVTRHVTTFLFAHLPMTKRWVDASASASHRGGTP